MPEQPEARIVGVQRLTDRHGHKRAYYRRKGWPTVTLNLAPGAPSLADQVAAIEARRAGVRAAAARPVTIMDAMDAYEMGADYAALARSTQADYRARLRRWRATIGPVHLTDVDAQWLQDVRDAWAKRGYRAANVDLALLKQVLRRAQVAGDIAANVWQFIEPARRPHGAPERHPIWTAAEVAAVLAAAPPGLARAVALGRYAGARPQDAITIGEAARKAGRLTWRSNKRGVIVDLPEPAALAAFLAATPRRAITIAYRPDGQPWPDRRAYDKALRGVLRVLEAAGQVRPGLTAHGLRHSFGVELALAGATDAEIMAALGHTTTAMAIVYRRQAERLTLADSAMAKIAPIRPPAADEEAG